MLKVPYFQQSNGNSCGAAAFKMVFKYWKPGPLVSFNQEKMFAKYAQQASADTQEYKIDTADIISEAQRRNFEGGWGRVSRDRTRLLDQLNYFLIEQKVPLIACQRYTADKTHLGHFRVLLAASTDEVIFHDPCPVTGGREVTWSMRDFIEAWRFRNSDITGGVAIWIADKSLTSPLDLPAPNEWAKAEGAN